MRQAPLSGTAMETIISTVINHELSEADVRTKFITPAIIAAGWDPMSQLREEYRMTAGRVTVRGKIARRSAAKRAD